MPAWYYVTSANGTLQWVLITLASTFAAVVAVDVIRRIIQRRTIDGKGHYYPLPPGPTPLPLFGSAFSLNTRSPWLTYTEWRTTYGDILYLRLVHTEVIVLNSTSVAVGLLEKRSRIYSARPFVITAMPYGHECNFLFWQYGDPWRACRRIFHDTFRAGAALGFRPMQLICNLLDDPDEYYSHFQSFSASIAMSAVYDYEPRPRNDPMVSIVNGFLEASMPGLTLGRVVPLEAFPFLLRMPDWLPGSWFSREAKRAYALMNKMVEVPYKHVQERMESKEHVNSAMVPDHIVRMENQKGTFLQTSSVLMTFTLAMVENPHVWKRAQAEIDAVVGFGRYPDFDDRPSLPYVDAVLRETLRWRPVTPMLAPHAVESSDVYRGYYIPKGATVFVNAWGLSRDEARYPNAEKFMPERFLDAEGRLTDDNPSDFIFEFGRRICPGRYAADGSLWSAMVTMLAALDFNLAKDADGNDVVFEATFTSGATDRPNPFPCQLTPRAHVNKEALGRVLARS